MYRAAFSRPVLPIAQINNLPWRCASTSTNSGGRGRGSGRVAPRDVFGSAPRPSSNDANQELSDIVANWKKPKKSNFQRDTSNTNDQSLEQGDLSKILGDVINKQHEDSEIESQAEEQVSGEETEDNEPIQYLREEEVDKIAQKYYDNSAFRTTSNKKFMDLPHSAQELEDQLNSPEGLEKFGKILGLTKPPNVRWNLTSDYCADPVIPAIEENAREVFSNETTHLPATKAEVKSYAERLLYSGTPDEQMQIETLKEFLRTPRRSARNQIFDANMMVAMRSTDYKIHHNIHTIAQYQHDRGAIHGETLREFTQDIGELYEQHSDALDDSFDLIIRKKSEKDPEWGKRHKAFMEEWDAMKEELELAEEEYGRDHEVTLQLHNKLHRAAISHCRTFSLDDYEVGQIELFRDHDDIPLHEDYMGPDGNANLQRDFENRSVKLLPYDEAMKKFPKASNCYFDGIYDGFTQNSQREADELFFHAERIDTAHFRSHDKVVLDMIKSQRWEQGGESVTMPIPTNLPDFLATQLMIDEYQHHQIEFRDHLENFIVTRLTKELQLLKDDNEDFYQLATKLDQIRETKRKKFEEKAFVMERAKQRAIDNGSFVPPRPSIVARALARKGFVDEQDVLDQALEELRRDGKRFTHKDIPAIRVENFNQKFRAIYFNGSLKPMDKARMVAQTITNFINTPDELKVAGGAYDVMSTKLTEFEKKQKEEADKRDDMSVNVSTTRVVVGNEVRKAKLTQKKEGEVSLEGYNTSDFEDTEVEEVGEELPSDFAALAKFKDPEHAKYYARWAEAVDIPDDIPIEETQAQLAMDDLGSGESESDWDYASESE